MEKRLLLTVIVLGVLGWAGLKLIEWQFKIGDFAKSPQYVSLRPAGRIIVGGGRAVLGLKETRRDKAVVQIRCSDGEEEVRLEPGQPSEEICGIRVRWTGPSPRILYAQQFEVSWAME